MICPHKFAKASPPDAVTVATVIDSYGNAAAHERWPSWSATKLRSLARQGREVLAKKAAERPPAPVETRPNPFGMPRVLDRGIDLGTEFELREYETIARWDRAHL